MTGSPGDDDGPARPGMAVHREAQRNGAFGRLTDIQAGGREVGDDRHSARPGDSLKSASGPKEDGVDHRAEPPPTWLVNSESEAAPDPKAFGRDDRPAGRDAAAVRDPAAGRGTAQGYGSAGHGPAGNGAVSNGAAEPAAASSVHGSPSQPAGPGRGYAPAAAPPPASPPPLAPGQVRMPQAYPSNGPAGPQTGPLSRITGPLSAALTKPRSQRQSRNRRAQLPPARPLPQAPAGSGTRKAQLVLARVEPWSVMKFSFLISLVGWVVLFVAVAVIYLVLSKLGVFTAIEHNIGLVTSSKGNPGTNAASWFAASRVLGYTMLAGFINVILITALATVGAVVYNLVTNLGGGVEVTLKETD